MAVRYSGHVMRTRQQAAWLSVAVFAVLAPLAIVRLRAQPPAAALGLAMLTLAPFVIAYQSFRFLESQERVHHEATPEMEFVFRFLANTPLTFGAFLFLVLIALR